MHSIALTANVDDVARNLIKDYATSNYIREESCDLSRVVQKLIVALSGQPSLCILDPCIFENVYLIYRSGLLSLSMDNIMRLSDALCSNAALTIAIILRGRDDTIHFEEFTDSLNIYLIVLSHFFKEIGNEVAKNDKVDVNFVGILLIIFQCLTNIISFDIKMVLDTSDREFDCLQNIYMEILQIYFINCSKNKKISADLETVARLLHYCNAHLHMCEGMVTCLMNLMRNEESVAHIVSHSLSLIKNEQNSDNIVICILNEICNEGIPNDNALARNCSLFLCDMVSVYPDQFSERMHDILKLLNNEWHSLRSSVITIVSNLCSSNLSLKMPLETSTKVKLIDLICGQGGDVSAFTRVRVLQELLRLCELKDIPIEKWNTVAYLSNSRLCDKSSIVRKAAMQLITSELQYNPFGPILDKEIFQKTLNDQTRKLKNMIENSYIEKDLPAFNCEREIFALEVICKSLSCGIEFMDLLEHSMRICQNLMLSGCTSDVLEALSLIVLARNFQFPPSNLVLRKALILILSDDVIVRDAVVEAFRVTFMSGNQKLCCEKLIELVHSFSFIELFCTQKILCHMLSKGIVSEAVFKELHDFAIYKMSPTRQGRLNILKLCEYNLSVDDENYSCFQKNYCASMKKVLFYPCTFLLFEDGSPPDEYLQNNRLDIDVYDSAFNLFGPSALLSPNWFLCAREALRLITKIHPRGNSYLLEIINSLSTDVFSLLNSPRALFIDNSRICKLLFLIGHAAQQELNHFDGIISKLTNLLEQSSSKGELKDSLQGKSESVIVLQDKLDVYMSSGSIAGKYSRFVSNICMKAVSIDVHPLTRLTGCFALGCIMSCSQVLCERYVCVLFHLFEVYSDASTRSQALLSIFDLYCRYPNVLEPFHDKICTFLRTENVHIRHTALILVIFCIANGSMKARPFLTDLSLCLEDENSEIKERTQTFFRDYFGGHESGELYNSIPFIISKLSTLRLLSLTSFQNISSFLASLITLENQIIALTKKFCARMKAATMPGECQKFMFFVSRFTFNERSLKILFDLRNCYLSHVAAEGTTLSNLLMSIIRKAKRTCSIDFKCILLEFEDVVMKACKAHGV